MIPKTYEEWKHCIEKECLIPLTNTFCASRIEILENESHPETMKFKELYGESHLDNVLNWYRIAILQ